MGQVDHDDQKDLRIPQDQVDPSELVELHARVKREFLALRELATGPLEQGLARIADHAVRDEVASLLGYDRSAVPLIREQPTDVATTADRSPPQLIGSVLGGRFEVQAPVAEGGFGWVYRGRDRERDEAVAVKLFKPLRDPRLAREAEAAFRREGQVLGELALLSPHVVAYRGTGTWIDQGQPYPFIVMEWLDGPTLGQLCYDGAGRPFAQAVELLAPVAGALALAHERGVAHRDLKPSNVLCVDLPDGPTLKLVDFGAAKLASERARGFDSTGGQIGMITFACASPEQFDRTRGPTGPWSDVHALALLLGEVALGRSAWHGLDLVRVMDRIMDPTARPTPRSLGLTVSDAVEAVMLRALSVDCRARYRDASSFWADLTAALVVTSDGHEGG